MMRKELVVFISTIVPKEEGSDKAQMKVDKLIINFEVAFTKDDSLENEEESILPEYNWKNKVILIVEDDEINYKFLEAVLQDTQAQILQTDSGTKAVELCKSISKIDIILMDLKLPDINGFEATRQIREFNKTIPIIAQTAFVLENEKERCLQAGCNDQIIKPIEIEKLLIMINKYLTE